MSRIFISYSSKERPEALSIQEWLEKNGWEDDVFVDVDPEHGLTGGEGWRNALRDAAGRCEAVILLLSRAWLASKPCWNEFQLAEKYGKPCIPVRIDEGIATEDIPKEITNNYQFINKVSIPLSEFEVRLKRALEAAGAGPENFSLPEDARPYPGLKALTEQDAALLFGRDNDVLAALDTLRDIRATGRKRVFVILGASGAGKSSLMRAGLYPRLKRDDRNFIVLPTVRPANAVLSGQEGLWQALEIVCADKRYEQHLSSDIPRTKAAIRLSAEQTEGTFAKIVGALQSAASRSFVDSKAALPSVVLPLDQGEELFNSEGALEVDRFFKLIRPIWENDAGFILIIAIRSDVYPLLQIDSRIPDQQLRPFNLSPMPVSSLSKVIEGPAKRLGFVVEPALTAKLLEDSEGADALPLLAFTLERLYDERLDSKKLTLSDYERLGGVRGAIQVAATKVRDEALANGMPAKALDSLLRRTFLPYLARVNEAGEFARRVAQLSELDAECLPLIDLLVSQRLLIADQRDDEKTVEIAHEAILREWSLLAGWLDAERGFLEWREQIGRARKLFDRDEGDLLTGRALDIAKGFMEVRQSNIDDEDQVFIQQSIDADDRRLAEEKAEQEARQQAELKVAQAREKAAVAAAEAEKKIAVEAKRSSTKMRSLAAVLAIVAIGAAIAGYIAFDNGQKAKAEAVRAEASEKQAKQSGLESESRRIALVAEDVRERHGDEKALALAWLAAPYDLEIASRPVTNEVSTSIYHRIIGSRNKWEEADVHVSPNGKKAILINNDEVSVLSTYTLEEKVFFNGKLKSCSSDNAFSSDGSSLVLCDESNIFFFDTHEFDLLKKIRDVGYIEDFKASPSHSHVAFGNTGVRSSEYILRVIDVDSGVDIWKKAFYFLPVNGGGMHRFSFNRPSSRIVVHYESEYRQYKTDVWDFSKNSKVFSIDDRNVGFVDFDWSGKYLVYNELNGGVYLDDIYSGINLINWKPYYDEGDFPIESHVNSHDVSVDIKELRFNGLYNSSFYDDSQLLLVDNGLNLINFEKNSYRRLCAPVDSMAYISNDLEFALCDSGYTHDGVMSLVDTSQGLTKKKIKFEELSNVVFIGDTYNFLAFEKDKISLWNGNSGTAMGSIFKPDGEYYNFDEKNDFTKDRQGRSMNNFVFSVLSQNLGSGEEEPKLSNSVYFWDFYPNKPFIVDQPNESDVIGVVGYSEAGWLVHKNNIVKVYSPLMDVSSEYRNHTGDVVFGSFSLDGDLVITGSWDKTAQIWKSKTGKSLKTLEGHQSGVTIAKFSPNAKLALTASHDATAKIWEVESGKLLHTLAGHTGSVLAASFSPNGTKVLTASTDSTAIIWDVETGKQLHKMEGHFSSIFTASFDKTGEKVLTASEDHTAKVWDVNTGKVLATLDGHRDIVNDAQWSPNSRYIVTSSEDKRSRLWNAENFELHAELKGHLGAVHKARFSPDEKQLVTASDDQTWRLWDVETGALMASREGHDKAIHDVVFNDSGKLIMTASADGSVRAWKIFPNSLRERIAEVGEWVTQLKPLTREECEQHGVLGIEGADAVCGKEVAPTTEKREEVNG